MRKKMNINCRRSIHAVGSQLPSQDSEESYNEESQDFQNDSQANYHTESDSNYEESDSRDSTRSPSISNRRSFERMPQENKSQIYQERSKTTNVSESNTSKIKDHSGTHVSDSRLTCKICGAIIVLVLAYAAYAVVCCAEKKCSYNKLQEMYPKEASRTWRTLAFAVESILNKRGKSPEIFLFAHHDSEHIACLVEDVASHTSLCFGKEVRLVKLDQDDFASDQAINDYGYAIEKYKTKVKEGKVILIAHLNEIPAEAARALHAICDTFNPIAPDVVMFLTLTIPHVKEGNVEAVVEDTLVDLWGQKLKRNELDALITRVTYQVIALKS